MLAILKIRYLPDGKAGLDLDTVIELVKLMKAKEPISVIEKVMFLSKELITDGN